MLSYLCACVLPCFRKLVISLYFTWSIYRWFVSVCTCFLFIFHYVKDLLYMIWYDTWYGNLKSDTRYSFQVDNFVVLAILNKWTCHICLTAACKPRFFMVRFNFYNTHVLTYIFLDSFPIFLNSPNKRE